MAKADTEQENGYQTRIGELERENGQLREQLAESQSIELQIWRKLEGARLRAAQLEEELARVSTDETASDATGEEG